MNEVARTPSDRFKKFNHHHELVEGQQVCDVGTGMFIADKQRIPLLKALNECGLETRTHCYGHETGYSFVSIILNDDVQFEIKKVQELHAGRTKYNDKTELLISWKRKD